MNKIKQLDYYYIISNKVTEVTCFLNCIFSLKLFENS